MFGIKTFYRDETNTLVSSWLMAPKEMLSKEMRILVFDTAEEAKSYCVKLKSRRRDRGAGWFEVAPYDGVDETVKMYWQGSLNRFS